MMARENHQLIFGVSLWGQGDDPFLLYGRKPIGSFLKWIKKHKTSKHSKSNLNTYFSPAFTWSRKLLNGNIKGIHKANKINLERFMGDHGKPDVIHVQASYPGVWIASELSKCYNIPFIVTLRMSPFPFTEFLHRGELRQDLNKNLAQACMLIATSHSLEERARAFGLTNIKTIHNPVDLSFFEPVAEFTGSDSITLLTVGRLEDQKGFDLLIKAVSKLDFDFRLDIIGEGSERKSLERMISEFDLHSKVILHGEVDRLTVRDYMQRCDGYVLSSRHETFGNVLLEAMACGKPSVATRCGGPEDIITDSVGILCDKDSTEALALAIKKMIKTQWDPGEIRHVVEKRFSPVTFTESMGHVYKQCAKARV